MENREERLEWISYPAKKDWKKTILLVLAIIIVCQIVYLGFQDVFFVVLAVLFLSTSLFRYFVPTRYIFTPEEICVRYLFSKRSYKWEGFKSYYTDKSGVLLSPYKDKSRLENIRGLYIIFSNNKESVVEFIKNKVGLPEADR